jgi:preprotein translocase subunit SecA
MLKGMLAGLIGTRHDREEKRVQPIVDAINEEYERLHSVSEEELRGQTEKFRARIREATSELEARIAELKAEKHGTADAGGARKNRHRAERP